MVSEQRRQWVLRQRKNRRIGTVVFALFGMGVVIASLLGAFAVDRNHKHRQAFDFELPMALSDAEETRAAGLYAQRCSGCHGVSLEGDTGPALVGVVERRAYGRVVRTILNGKGRNKQSPMPGDLLNSSEAELVARWLLSWDMKPHETRS